MTLYVTDVKEVGTFTSNTTIIVINFMLLLVYSF
jgi:hypothetical protein